MEDDGAHGYTEGAEVPLSDDELVREIKKLTFSERRALEREYKFVKINTVHKHNLRLLHENSNLKKVIKNLNIKISEAERIIWAARDGIDFRELLSDYTDKYHQ